MKEEEEEPMSTEEAEEEEEEEKKRPGHEKSILARDKIELGKEAAMAAEEQAAREREVLPLETRISQFREMLSEKQVSNLICDL